MLYALVRLVLIACAISFALSILRSVIGSIFGGLKGGSPPQQQPRDDSRTASGNAVQRLVKDPVCGVYIPESSAIRVGDYAYCSEDCRRKHRL